MAKSKGHTELLPTKSVPCFSFPDLIINCGVMLLRLLLMHIDILTILPLRRLLMRLGMVLNHISIIFMSGVVSSMSKFPIPRSLMTESHVATSLVSPNHDLLSVGLTQQLTKSSMQALFVLMNIIQNGLALILFPPVP